MSAFLAARKILQDRLAAAEARALAELEEHDGLAKDAPTPDDAIPASEVLSDALNVHPASSSNTSAASVVATSSTSTIAAFDIVASTTACTACTACTIATASAAFDTTAAASAAETVSSDAIEEAASSSSVLDELNFDTSANRSRRWRYQNVLKAQDHNVNGQVRRKQREQLDPKLRERRREQLRECRERDRDAARRVGLKPSDPRWKEMKGAQWQRKQQQSGQRAKAEASYFSSKEYMISKTANRVAAGLAAWARREAHKQLAGMPTYSAELLCDTANTNAPADAQFQQCNTMCEASACASDEMSSYMYSNVCP